MVGVGVVIVFVILFCNWEVLFGFVIGVVLFGVVGFIGMKVLV